MSDIVIKVENLSKQYRLGLVGTGTISHDLNRWWARIRGKEDPTLKIGESNDRAHKGESDYVWALKDINFEVKQGEVLGIIGRNGAGKSTLLKILSRVTAPTTGEITGKGRIASLLEVGTGFHPELTGRENVYLNGAINGMTKAEVKSKLDEIIDFSGCERYIDTPVKRYSSGMTVRLGFAVAAHLDPEILIVDEVLAVGDAEFQKKCIGKMQDVAGDGRTVLFVSHNMTAVYKLCNRAILLTQGFIELAGNVELVVCNYLSGEEHTALNTFSEVQHQGEGGIEIINLELISNPIRTWGGLDVIVTLKSEVEEKFDISLAVKRMDGNPVCQIYSQHGSSSFMSSRGQLKIRIGVPSVPLSPGKYRFNLWVGRQSQVFDWLVDCMVVEVLGDLIGEEGATAHATPYPVTLNAVWSEL
jgi:lipopolysaccharide transport system ATP-binding protein